MLQEAGLPEGRLPDVWGVENPQAVQAIHRAYLEAGCRLITTNTFGTTAPKVEPYGYTVGEIMATAVGNVRAAMAQAGGAGRLRLRRHRPHGEAPAALRGPGL